MARPSEPIPAIGYVRVSTAREEMISPEIQRDAIDRWARSRNRRIVEWVEDLDLSGRDFARRRIAYCIERIEAGQAREIAVWKYSRFGRNRAGSALNLARLETTGGQLQSATEQVDAATSLGKLTRGMLMELDAYQSDVIGEGWQQAHAYRRERGLPHGGHPRYGYLRRGRLLDPATGQWARDPADDQGERWEPDPDTGPVLREMYERIAGGESGNAVCADLNRRGIPGPAGRLGSWRHSTLWSVLDSGFGCGWLRVHDPECEQHRPDAAGVCLNRTWLPGAQPHLWETDEERDEIWSAYRRRRADAPRPPRAREARYELTGILACGRCGAGMHAHRNPTRTPGPPEYSWICPQAHRGACSTPINSASDRMVRQAVRDILAAEADRLAEVEAEADAHRLRERREREQQTRGEEIEGELERIARALDRLTERYAEDEIPRDAYERTRDRYLARRGELESERSQLDGGPAEREPADYIPVIRSLVEEWETLATHRTNTILRGLVEITAHRQDRRTAHVVIHTAWGTEHTAPSAPAMERAHAAISV